MTEAQQLNCDHCCGIVDNMKKCCDDKKITGKIDWSKLLTLLMQLLPLILTFFKPDEEQPKT